MSSNKKSGKKTESKRITSIDVANLAGVSQSSVSRAFNPGSGLAEETRQKVLEAARELGYTPNAIARSLTSRSTNIIGIVMANPSSPFYSQILVDFTNGLQRRGRQTLLFNAEPGHDIDDILSRVLEYQVDGLIITAATISSEMADQCAKKGTPVILFNRYVLGANVSAVCCDNVEGGRVIANYLLDSGHRNIAYMAGVGNASTTIDRLKGFEDRLRERGVIDFVTEYGDYSYESGYEAAKRLLLKDNPPDAIFCANDIMALGAMDAARFELGLKIPEDVSIVGFDDIPTAAWPTYSLTTIHQPLKEMVDATIELLEKRLEDPSLEPVLKLFPGELIERSSVGQNI